MSWDSLIAPAILIYIALTVISKTTGMGVKEMIEYVKDLAGEGADEVEEKAEEIIDFY